MLTLRTASTAALCTLAAATLACAGSGDDAENKSSVVMQASAEKARTEQAVKQAQAASQAPDFSKIRGYGAKDEGAEPQKKVVEPGEGGDGARIDFVSTVHDFGKIAAGDVVDHMFKFKNSGTAPLLIGDVKGS